MNNKMIFAGLILIVWVVSPLLCQGESDVYLSKWEEKGGDWILTKPIKISQKKGYNNQPSFHTDSSGVFYVASDGKQTDVFFYHIKKKINTQLTFTPESEYSPLVMPGGKEFSVIQLINSEGPRKGAQPLVAFPIKGGKPRLIYEKGKKVGYHAWIDKNQVALFILGSPSTLQVANLKAGTANIYAYNIGRSLYFSNNRSTKRLFFIQQIIGETAKGKKEILKRNVKYVDLDQHMVCDYFPMLRDNGFFFALPSGNLVMAVNSGIYMQAQRSDKKWHMKFDLSRYGISQISRIAQDPKGKWLAFVAHQK